MTVPQAQYDSVLIREHLFRDSKQLNLVIPSKSDAFRPITEIGLGTFSYNLVDPTTVSENGTSNDASFLQRFLNLFQSFTINNIIGFILVLSILYVLTAIYSSVTKKSSRKSFYSVVDLEKQNGNPVQTSLMSPFAQATTFPKAQVYTPYSNLNTAPPSLSNSPLSPVTSDVDNVDYNIKDFRYTNIPEPISNKVLINRLRID